MAPNIYAKACESAQVGIMEMRRLIIRMLAAVHAQRLRMSGIRFLSESSSLAYTWRVRGARGSRLSIGGSSMVMTTIVLETTNALLQIGSRTFIGGHGIFSIASEIVVGDDVMLAWGCTVTDHDSHSLRFSERATDVVDYLGGRKNWNVVDTKRTVIGDKVWIGFNSSVLKGVTIGEGSVIAANSNVTKDVPPWSLVGGNPARVIRVLVPG